MVGRSFSNQPSGSKCSPTHPICRRSGRLVATQFCPSQSPTMSIEQPCKKSSGHDFLSDANLIANAASTGNKHDGTIAAATRRLQTPAVRSRQPAIREATLHFKWPGHRRGLTALHSPPRLRPTSQFQRTGGRRAAADGRPRRRIGCRHRAHATTVCEAPPVGLCGAAPPPMCSQYTRTWHPCALCSPPYQSIKIFFVNGHFLSFSGYGQ